MERYILEFLRELKNHNDRDWLHAHDAEYRRAKAAFDGFIDKLIPEIRVFDPMIDMITARDCVFRIYRDVRFSNDKSPYKTNFGAYIARGGKKSMTAGYYVHAEPGACMLAGGLYMPPPEVLKLIRNEIYYNIDEFRSIIGNPGFKNYFQGFDDEQKLRNAPKDFPKDFAGIDLLKYKSYAVWHDVPDEVFLSKDFLNFSLEIFRMLFTLNQFFYNCLK
jgi:uncharacterized protein (TIGR02453 family)